MDSESLDLHRKFGARYNNLAWDLVEAEARTPEDDARMLELALASYVHWCESGLPMNIQRAEHLVSTVHAALGNGEAALRHARRGQTLGVQNGDAQTPFDRACSALGLARAHAALGELETARSYKQRAREAFAQIVNPQGRATFEQLLEIGPWYGVE